MKTSLVKKMTALDRFFYWITERESIRKAKEAGQPWPWTADEILQRYRFCNVRRMDDKVSRWLLMNWYGPNRNAQFAVVACSLARFFNLPSTLEAIGFPWRWEPNRIKLTLRTMKKRGETIFNGAYMVRGNDGQDKVATVIDYTIQPLIDEPIEVDPSSMYNTWLQLEPRYGFGSFMAGQVVADLRWLVDGSWRDRRSWAPAGPGSIRGMNRLHGRPIGQLMSQEQFQERLATIMKIGRSRLFMVNRRLEAMDWQNCLCEFDKYSRVLFGEGQPKQTYRGPV